MLRHELDDAFLPFVHLVFPQMSARDLLAYLAEELGAKPADTPRYTVEESVRRLQSRLTENTQQGRHAVVVIDEAHLLEDCGALETLRLLLNFELAGRPGLTLVLVGQPALLSAVSRLQSLDERVGVKTLLRALTVDETASYVQHRMMAAGATRDIFTAEAAEAVHYLAQGIPRQIDRLCDLALVVGFAEGLAELTAPQIEAVSAELVTVSPE
jgi:general secretion pathway protein A